MLQQRQAIVEGGQKITRHNGMLSERENQQTYQQALETLVSGLQGEVVCPDDPDYQSVQIVWNGAAQHYPALIVKCANADDVSRSVTFAREQNLELSVRSGGHSLAGYGTNDGGMVIDLSHMKSIRVDPESHIAWLEPGLIWGEVADTLQPYGLALSSGDTRTVGVGGLLLGGGIGWMARKYGLTLDHLRAVELVTADGAIVRASTEEHADLFWGVRGGGGNFGIATSFEVNLHPAGIVLGGAVFYEIAEAEVILREYAQYAASAPDELTTMAMLMVAPPVPFIPAGRQGKPVVAVSLCYTGDLAQGAQVIAPLRRLGTVIADVIAPIPYPVMFTFTEEATRPGFPQYARSLFTSSLSDDVVQSIVFASAGRISQETILQIRILGGAVSRVPADATAFAHRDTQVMLSVFSTEFQPGNDEHLLQAEQVWQSLRPYAEGVYVNFLADEGEQRIKEAYPTATYERLAALKERYDPTNLFHLNQNIRPATR